MGKEKVVRTVRRRKGGEFAPSEDRRSPARKEKWHKRHSKKAT